MEGVKTAKRDVLSVHSALRTLDARMGDERKAEKVSGVSRAEIDLAQKWALKLIQTWEMRVDSAA